MGVVCNEGLWSHLKGSDVDVYTARGNCGKRARDESEGVVPRLHQHRQLQNFLLVKLALAETVAETQQLVRA